ncbi:hypothetical protein ABT56_07415 [Photobacterium aquae]|uniref:Uncharacterized protein n=1 Tax=Photobacterium aquae TaxID=1195763 RepID=A0A0J1H5J5_9GAMM|nr:hypothetical protein [Photobacterium aquae]KLV06971.1 hypothetical protein ABT56_07415 [Photobacterium aquae]
MDAKRTWGFVTLILGCASLLVGAVALGSLVGHSQIAMDVGGFFDAARHEVLPNFHVDQHLDDFKKKYQHITIVGIFFTSLGAIMMRGKWQ